MADVIELDAHRPHYAGPCSCLKCAREWVGVVPETTEVLECPSCGALAGVIFSAREVRLIRALEKVATGYAIDENSSINLSIAKQVASDALGAEGWGNFKTT